MDNPGQGHGSKGINRTLYKGMSMGFNKYTSKKSKVIIIWFYHELNGSIMGLNQEIGQKSGKFGRIVLFGLLLVLVLDSWFQGPLVMFSTEIMV